MDQKTVLLVDDEFHILNVLTLKLRNANFNVVTASNGEEALERIAESVPDLMITDYSMPEMNGWDLVRKVRSVEKSRNMPIIMLTARGQTIEEEEASKQQIDMLMSKPFSPREMLERVEALLSVARG